MNTARSDRFTALLVAIVMTLSLNGAMLWKFDSVAQDATVTQHNHPATAVSLNTVGAVFSYTA